MNADNLLTGMIALELGLIVPEQLEACVKAQAGQLDPRPLGELLREKGYLTPKQLDRLLQEQKRRFTEFSEARLFGQVALSRHFVTEQQLGECIREQLRHEKLERPLLGQVMLRKNYLTLRQFAEVIADQGKALYHCPGCDRFHVFAANTTIAKAVCPTCKKLLRLVDDAGIFEGGTRDRKGDTTVFFKVPLANLGKFQILGEIARGSMGIVFKAYDATLDRTVALKVLKEGELDDGFIKRLHREGAIAAKLHHPNIVTVHEVGETHGLHYLCMDYIAGTDLMTHIRRFKMDRKASLRMFETICRAVHYAHVQGVIHRDLKPTNILVDAEGRPIITDFGLAKSLDAALDMTKEGTSLGTPHYMPPEQVLGAVGKIDPRSDVYSLGAILYEILTGRPPFVARTTMEMYQKVLSEEPDRPSQLDRTVEADLEAIVLKALEKERELRYFSAEDLALDLARYLSGEPVMATRATGAKLVFRRFRKHKTRILTLAGVALATILVMFMIKFVERGSEIDELERQATALKNQGRWDEARDVYTKIQAIDPEHEGARTGIAECYDQIRKQLDAAKRAAEDKGRKTAEEEREEKMLKAWPHFATGQQKFNDAYTLMQQPDFDVRELRRRYHEAIGDFTEAIKRADFFPDAYYLRARCLILLDVYGDAEADLTTVIRLAPSHSAAHFERGKVRIHRALLASGPQYGWIRPDVEDPLAIERTYTIEGQQLLRLAAEDFQNAVLHSKGQTDTQFAMAGFMCLAEHRLHDAVVHFCRAIALNQVNVDAHFGCAYAHLISGNYGLAVRHFDQAVRWRPNHYAAHGLRALAHFALQEYDQAVRGLEEVATKYPHAVVFNNLSVLYQALGRWEDAERTLRSAIEKEPDDLTMHAALAAMLFQAGKFDDAIVECKGILGHDPKHPNAHKIAALCYASRGDVEAAEQHFKRARDLDPRDDQNVANYASTLQQAGRREDALGLAEEAIAINPQNAHARLVRAIVLAEQGRLEAAVEEFLRALEIEPDHALGRVQYGLVLHDLKRYADAIREWEKAARLDPKRRAQIERLIEEARKKQGE